MQPIWRPGTEICVKVTGLVFRHDGLPAMDMPDDSGRLKGVRAPGGTIEFGETREEALVRELDEEFPEEGEATWYPPADLRDEKVELYPAGLREILPDGKGGRMG